MSNGFLVETTKDWIIVKIPRKLLRARKKVVLTATRALQIFKRGKEEFRAGKVKQVSSLKEIL